MNDITSPEIFIGISVEFQAVFHCSLVVYRLIDLPFDDCCSTMMSTSRYIIERCASYMQVIDRELEIYRCSRCRHLFRCWLCIVCRLGW